ncbi:replication initiation protein [Tortoise microvirus 100]|nr:replication initiation protein [Tortoise microvirus 100]
MKCFYPYFRKVPYSIGDGNDYSVPYPCGRCEWCRKQQASIWSLRLQFEAMRWQNIGFVTLTYNDLHVPDGYNLSPEHLQSFLKRLRFYLPYKIKFFACGEYGTKRGRPHYHLVIFGLKPEDYKYISIAWSYGFVDVSPLLSANGLAYVAKYTTKKIGSMKEVSKHYSRRVVPFLRCSKFLGISFVESCTIYTNVVRINGYIKYIGRYLTNKLKEKFNINDENKYSFSYNFIADVVSKFEHKLSTADTGFNFHVGVERFCYDLYIQQFRFEFLQKLKLQKDRIFDGSQLLLHKE